MAKKPIEFMLYGEGVVSVSADGEKEYLEALASGDDIIHICIKTKGFNITPVMRSKIKMNDSTFMINGGFAVKRIGKSRKFKVNVDGVVSTDLLGKKDLEAIAAGSATCTLEKIGSRNNWNLSDEYGVDEIKIYIAR
jgi:hypothetical protein